MRRFVVFAVAALLLFGGIPAPEPLAPVTSAQARDHKADKAGKSKGKSHEGGNGNKNTAAAGDSSWDRAWDAAEFLAAGFTAAALRDLLGSRTELLNTGARQLPPGIEKNLARGKALPPGLSRRAPPDSLAATLPQVAGHDWAEIGTNLVLIEAGTQIVREIVRGVLR